MSNFKEFATEEEYNAAISEALEAKNQSWISGRLQEARDKAIKETEAKYKDYEQLKEASSTWKDKEESYKTQIKDLNDKYTASESSALKMKAAYKHKIPFELAERINGSTAEEIDADAKAISQFVTASSPSSPLRNTEGAPTSNAWSSVLSQMK